MTIVETRGLTKAYGRQPPALRDVDLEIGEGVTGLLGPNGAGKSTLIQCVLGLLPDYTGEVRVLGLDARTEQAEIRRRVGFMPENDCHLERFPSALRTVRFLAQLTGMSRQEAMRRAHEVLNHVGLGEAIFRKVEDFSTGMRQRFKLAQALVHDPELVFLDEPLSGLDPKGRDEVLELIQNLAKRHGKHVVWSSHILPDVQKVAESIVIMNNGRSRGVFGLDELEPRANTFELEVDGNFAAIESALERAGFEITSSEQNDPERSITDGGTFVARTREEATAPIFTALEASGFRVRRVVPVTESLDDLFARVLADDDEALIHSEVAE